MSYNPQFAKLGEILVNENIITEEQLQQALVEQKQKNDKLGNILVSNGTITEDDLVKAFSLQVGSKSISEDEQIKAPADIVKLLTEDFAKENNVEMSVLKGAWETKLRVRPERDWEQLKGRAVSSDENE